jgi:hypothetical protein
MFSPWDRTWLTRQPKATVRRRGAAPGRRRPDRKPAVECLEDRVVPAAWAPLGPAPITNGQTAGSEPVSGRVTGVAADPLDANTLFIAAAGGGVWKTTNGGTSWTPLTDNLTDINGNPIVEFMGAIAETRGGLGNEVVYAGTGEANNSNQVIAPPGFVVSNDSFYGEGILVSLDGGATWTLENANGAFTGRTVSKIAIDPTNSNIAYAAIADFGVNGATGNTGIWKTIDGGVTWTNTTAANGLSSTDPWSDVVVDPNNPLIVYAAEAHPNGATGNGVYKSTNGGATWNLLNGTGTFNGTQDGRIALALFDNGVTNELFVSIAQPINSGGALFKMLKSTTGGTSFTDLTANVTAVSNYLGGQGSYDTTLVIDPFNANYIFAAGAMSSQGPTFAGSPLQSFDGGTTWHDIATDPASNGPHTDSHAAAFDAAGNLLDGDDGGVFKLSNPTNVVTQRWSSLNSNLQTITFTGIAADPTNAAVVYGGSQDNGTEKTTGPVGWNRIFAGDGGIVRVDPTNHNVVYTERAGISIAVSINGGASFNFITAGISATNTNFYNPYVLDPAGHIYYGSNFLNLSINQGTTWSKIGKPGVAGFNPAGAAIDAIAVSPSNTQVIYVSAGGHIFVTQNGGTNWTQRDLPNGETAGARNSLTVDPNNPGTAYAVVNAFTGGGNHVFQTTNFGTNWTDISTTLFDTPVNAVATDATGGIVYVGTDVGVYVTGNGGANWSRLGTGLPNAQVVELDVVSGLGVLDVGTHGRGAFQLNLNTPPAAVTTVTSSSPNRIYGIGASISIQVTFNGPVFVTGTPQLALNNGGIAFYTGGSGTSTLTFTYTVGAADGSKIPPGIHLDYASSAALTGGTITDFNGMQANRTLPAPGAAGSLGANKQIFVYTGPTNGRNAWTANNDNYNVASGTMTTFASVLSNDVPNIGLDSPTIVPVTPLKRTSGNAVLTFFQLNADGTITFRAVGFGTFTFSYYILDSAGHKSNIAQVTITVF